MNAERQDEFAALVAEVKIENVRQVEGTFTVELAAPVDAPHELTINHAYRFVRRVQTLLVYIRFLCDVTPEQQPEAETKTEPSMNFRAVFELQYLIPEGTECSEETLGRFAANNGVFNAWPYCREFIQQASVRAGVPPIVIPAFRVPGEGTVLRANRPPKMPQIAEK
jgi:hypothetical protein